MKIIITGGSGYLGSWLCRTFVSRGEEVVNFDLLPSPSPHSLIRDIQGDIRDASSLSRAFAGADVVIHSAARVPLTKALREFETINVGGTRTVLEVAQKLRVPKVIHISSSAVFGIPAENPVRVDTPRKPVDPYGVSKARAEMECEKFRERGLNVVIIRPRTIVGPERLGIFHILFDWIRRDMPVFVIGSGNNKLQFVSVRDLCQACVLGIQGANFATVGIGGRSFGTLREDLTALIAHAKSRSGIVSLPASPTIWTLAILDKLNLSPFAAWHYLTYHIDFFYDDTATRVMGYCPQDGNVEILCNAYDSSLQENQSGAGVVRGNLSPHRRAPRQGLLTLLKWRP